MALYRYARYLRISADEAFDELHDPSAHLIHSMSRRKDRNFIKVNCAAIPTGLLEEEAT
jgi:transcriptional regulator of acetoin/glycerol metabolism